MADNNNGNPINDGYRNTSRDNSSDISMSISAMGMALGKNITESTNKIIDAINKNGSGNGNSSKNNSANKIKTEAEKIVEKFKDAREHGLDVVARDTNKSIKESLKTLEDLKTKARRGDKNAEKILKVKSDEISKYEDFIRKEKEADAEVEKLKRQLNSQKREAVRLERRQKDKDVSDEESEFITRELQKLKQSISRTKEDLQNATEQQKQIQEDKSSKEIGDNLRNIESMLTTVTDSSTDLAKTATKISDEQKRKNKKEEKQKKVDEAREYKLFDNLSEAFDGGLFNLGDNLSKVFKEATQKHLEGTRQGFLGNLIAFGEQTLFSMMDYNTNKLTEAISSLQTSFEGTGMSISKAILLDRDELASNWQDVADRLSDEGYSRALNTLDIFQLEEQATKAGITNIALMSEIAVAVGEASATTGIAAPDFMSSEALQNLQQIYTMQINAGKSEAEALQDVNEIIKTFGAQLGAGIDEMGNAFAYTEGKSQETYLNLLNQITRSGDIETALAQSASRVAVQGGMGSNAGGYTIFSQMQQNLNNLYETGISDDTLALVTGYGTLDKLQEEINAGNYTDIFTNMLTYLYKSGGMDKIGKADIAQAKIFKDVFGYNADDFKRMVQGAGGFENLISSIQDIEQQAQLGTESISYQTREAAIKSGKVGVTKEQGDRNEAVATMVDAWALTEKSGIREADKLLIQSINAANTGIQSAISALGELLVMKLAGAGGSGLSGLSTLGKGIAVIGTAVTAWKLGSYVNQKFGLSDKISDWMAGDVVPAMTAITNLKEIEDLNKEANEKYQADVLNKLSNSITLSTETKKILQTNLDDIVENITKSDNTKQAFAKTFRDTVTTGFEEDIQSGGKFLEGFKEITGKDYSDLSDEELTQVYSEHKGELNKLLHSTIDKDSAISESYNEMKWADYNKKESVIESILKPAIEDGYIQQNEGEQAYKDLENTLDLLDIKDEKDREEFREELGRRYRETNINYQGYKDAVDVMNYALGVIEDKKNSDWANISQSELDDLIARYANAIRVGGYNEMPSDLKEKAQRANQLGYFATDDYPNTTDGLTLVNKSLPYWQLYSSDNVKKFATGIDYVPYDNYLAYLHEGERVQTAAEARLDDLTEDIYYQNYSNTSNTNNNLDDLTTTNNSIDSGFESTTSNQETIIEALKAILNALTNNNATALYNSNNTIFNDINNNKTALRGNNISRLVSQH